jgi:uncharacterized damage-inducible protein DinB
MDLRGYFQQLAAYHGWATQRLLLDHVARMPAADYGRNAGLFFGSVHRTLNHLLVAETIWQARFIDGQSPALALDAELHSDRQALAQALAAAPQRWMNWLDSLDTARLDGTLSYRRASGEALSLPFAQTLGHVFNHATHHRGQVTAALTAMGHPGPELDWVRLLQTHAI